MKLLTKLSLLFALLYGGLIHAFTYQGELTDQGVAFTGDAEMTFTLHDSSTMGTAVGAPDVQVVTVTNGRFVVNLDQWMLFFDGTDLWLEITVDLTGSNAVTLTPRQKLDAAPYAEFSYDGVGDITAVSAGSGLLGGGATGDVNLSVNTSIIQQRVGSSCAVGQAMRSIAADGTVTCQATSGGGSYSAGTGLTLTGTTFNVNVGSGNGLDADLLDGMDSTDFMAATADSWVDTTGDTMSGQLDITNSNSGFMLSVQNNDVTSGDGIRAFNKSPNIFDGALFASNDSSGNGVYGVSTSGIGVHGVANGTTGSPYGVFGIANETTGVTSVGVRGESKSDTGTGVSGVAPWVGIFGEATATTGENYGVYGITDSTVGYGVYGKASNTGGKSYGVYGTSSSVNGYGVFGKNTNAAGAGVRGEALNGNAVEGIVDFTNNGTGTGVYGSGGFFGAAAKFENAVTGTAAVTIQNSASPTAPALVVTGSTDMTGPLTVTGSTDMTGPLTVTGSTDITGPLLVTGSSHVEGQLTWKPVTSYLSIPASAFGPHRSSAAYRNYNDALIPQSDGTNSILYYAPVLLPHGAIVTKLTFTWADSSSYNGFIKLYRQSNSSTSRDLMVSILTYGQDISLSPVTSITTSINFPVTDNSLYNYVLEAWLQNDSSGGEIHLRNILIEYTIDKPY